MDRGAWQATVHGVAKSWTRLKPLSMHALTLSICPPLPPRGQLLSCSFTAVLPAPGPAPGMGWVLRNACE